MNNQENKKLKRHLYEMSRSAKKVKMDFKKKLRQLPIKLHISKKFRKNPNKKFLSFFTKKFFLSLYLP